MQAPEHLIERIKEAARKSESKPFPAMDRVWDKIEERLDEDSFQQKNEMPFPGMDKVWGKIEERLDQVQQQQTRTIPFRKLSVAAAILLLLGFGTFYFLQNRVHDINPAGTYAQQQSSGELKPDAASLEASNLPHENNVKLSGGVQQRNGWVANAKKHEHSEQTSYFLPPAMFYSQSQVNPDEDHGSYFSRKIKGHITDENGESLAGAIVQAKGSKAMAITDLEGNYEIIVRGNVKELEVRGAGMAPEVVAISPDGDMRATTLAPDPEVLADVSVYSKNNRKDYIASIVDQENGVANDRPLADIDRVIAGELPGVKIKKYEGAFTVSTDLLPGGFNVAGFSGRPLVIIDGALYSGTSIALKSAEVESLTILKDETAKAVYGSKGANGAILIKTKAGKGYAEPKSGIFRKMKNIFRRDK